MELPFVPTPELIWGIVATAVALILLVTVVRKSKQASTAVAERSAVRGELDVARSERSILAAERDKLVAERDAARKDAAQLKARLGETKYADVVSFLSMLQVKGRFIDFVMDDITKYPDAQVGAAARVVHQGCQGVVRDYFDIKPVCEEKPEGAAMTLDRGYDAGRFRLLGRVAGEPPFKGRLLHRGWQTQSVRLPELTGDAPSMHGIIAPAEVELH